MKLTLDAYDAVINLCEKQSNSSKAAKAKPNHVKVDSSLAGQIKAFTMVKLFCEQKKAKLLAK